MARYAVGWLKVPLVEVVFGGFWAVSDGFCWLTITSDCFTWFAVLVVSPILQYTEELTIPYSHGRT